MSVKLVSPKQSVTPLSSSDPITLFSYMVVN